MALVLLANWLEIIHSAAAFLVAAGFLGGLAGAFLQRRVDRERLLTEWKQSLRRRILDPKLDVARKLYARIAAGAIPTREEGNALRLDQSEVLLADLTDDVVKSIPALIKRMDQYEAFRQSLQMLSGELFEDEKQLDCYFEIEGRKSGEYYEQEVTLNWQNSERGRRIIEIKRNLPALAEDADERFAKLKRDFVIAHEIKADIQDNLINLMSKLKQITLRIA